MTLFTADQLILNTANISQERLDGEVVVISFNTGKYFSAKGPAADIFWLVQNGVDQGLWREILTSHFSNFDLEDSGISEFLASGIAEELFLSHQDPLQETIDLPSDYVREEWEAPRLVVFEDLQDLLLLDPVHDTSVEGWPAKKDE